MSGKSDREDQDATRCQIHKSCLSTVGIVVSAILMSKPSTRAPLRSPPSSGVIFRPEPAHPDKLTEPLSRQIQKKVPFQDQGPPVISRGPATVSLVERFAHLTQG